MFGGARDANYALAQCLHVIYGSRESIGYLLRTLTEDLPRLIGCGLQFAHRRPDPVIGLSAAIDRVDDVFERFAKVVVKAGEIFDNPGDISDLKSKTPRPIADLTSMGHCGGARILGIERGQGRNFCTVELRHRRKSFRCGLKAWAATMQLTARLLSAYEVRRTADSRPYASVN